MAILNYTTQIPVEKTISEIEKMLSESGATKILKEFDGDNNIFSISFMLITDKGELPFKLPMNVKAVMQVINNQTKDFKKTKYGKTRIIPKKFQNDYDQARRVGWRIIKDWLEAQLALFFLQMVKIEEIFLPYMYNANLGKTMFELLEERNFDFQLENKSTFNKR